MNDNVQKKLGNFNKKIEDEKKRILEEEDNRNKQEIQNQMLAIQKQEEMKVYVENKIETITGLGGYTLTQKEVKEDLQILYDSFKAIDLIQEEKKERNIDLKAKEVIINDETIFFDEDIVLEAQIREPFVQKIKELLNHYEQNVIPKIVDFETFNKYYFDEINKIMLSMCELYHKFLMEFDIENNDLNDIYEKNKKKWFERNYSFLNPLYNKLEDEMNKAEIRIDKNFEYDESYEPTIYNGPGVSNAINAKFQSEMIGIGINLVRMIGDNIGKYRAVEKANGVLKDIFKEIYTAVVVTSRFISTWMEDLIQDAINTLKSNKIIEISRIEDWRLSKIELFLSRLTWGTHAKLSAKQFNSVMNKIYCLNPFSLKDDSSSDEHFVFFFDLLEFMHIDYVFVIEYNIKSEFEISMYTKEATEKLNNATDADIQKFKDILSHYTLVEKIEYNSQKKNDIRNFVVDFGTIVQNIKSNKKKQEDDKEAHNANKYDAKTTKKIIDEAIAAGKLELVWEKIEEGVVYAEYAMEKYYDKLCEHAIDKYDLDELEDRIKGLADIVRGQNQDTPTSYVAAYIYCKQMYNIFSRDRRNEKEANSLAQSILELANGGNISAIAQKGFWGAKGYNNATATKQEAIKYLELAAKEQHPMALAWLGSFYRTGEVVGRIDKEKARYNLELSALYGHVYGIKELEKLNNGSTSSSACFITTATCKSLGKGDNCKELTSFRYFRDNWLIYQSDGKQLIEEYYKNAPRIVQNIDAMPDSTEIYGKIWDIYLKKCMEYIENKNYYACKNLYIEMVGKLMLKYS